MVEYLKKPLIVSTAICILIFYSGFFQIPVQNPYNGLFPLEKVEYISGQILSSPVKSSSEKTYSCNVKLFTVKDKRGFSSSASGIITVYIPSILIESFFPGKLYSPAKKEGAYLYEAGGVYNFTGRFTQLGFIVESCSNCQWPSDIFGKIDKFRALCRLQFKRLMFGWGEAGGLLLALLCGAREYTNSDVSNSFKNAGLSHILALSGMHLSMFSSIAIFFGDKVGRKKLTFIIRFIALVIFVWFAGFSPSLLRAFICAMLTLVATVSAVENPDMLVILSFSFIIQCIISPSDINNAGFLLSYGALAGILIANGFFFKYISKVMPGYFAASLSSSTSANLFTAPISIKLFGTFCPIGIIATTFVSPLVTIFIYGGLLFIVLSLIFPPLAVPSGNFINFLYTIIKNLVFVFSKVPAIKF